MKPSATSTEGTKRRAAIYREAARLLEIGDERAEYACCAISSAVHGSPLALAACAAHREDFGGIYRIDATKATGFSYAYFGSTASPENQNQRILALCFMAAMVEAGDA